MKHLADYQQIHRDNPRYGSGPGAVDRAALREWITSEETLAQCVIDYGCGNSPALFTLFPEAQFFYRYDPALHLFRDPPSGLKFAAGLCTDVMEHIPEDELDATLEHLWGLSPRWYFIIHAAPAAQRLPDGSNAHVSQHPPEWWQKRMSSWWEDITIKPLLAPYRFAMRCVKK